MKQEYDRIGLILYSIYLLLLVATAIIIGKLVYMQFIFEPEPRLESALIPKDVYSREEAKRGDILDRASRKLAICCPVYDIAIDCTVRKAEFESLKDEDKAKKLEKEWQDKAKELSKSLAVTFPKMSASKYFDKIIKGRKNGTQYLVLAKDVDRTTRNRVKDFPLFCEGKYKGGYIEKERIIRQYPYGSLGRRTIGFVRDNNSSSKNNIGIEGKYDSYLHGKDGGEWLRKSDKGAFVRNFDSLYVKPVDGYDVRTTLDVDYQDIADKALRAQIQDDNDVEGGCVILMEVKTGAIRAMVNLLRDSVTMRLTETENMAVRRLGDPGSVFKTSTLMTLLEDGKVHSLEETIPSNHGKIMKWEADVHVTDYERSHHTNRIPISEGLRVSSNYVFRYLAYKHYSDDCKHFLDKVYSYKFGEAFEFDLDGLSKPMTPPTDIKKWSSTTLGSVAIGYSICITPLHIINFYNAIANKGRMMKPYLIESIEDNGVVIEKRGESVLCESICSKATADTLTRGLALVASAGTARVLKDAKCTVAGKTGTAQVVLPTGGYHTRDGRKKNQGTFVGFFPAEDPQYSVIAVVYSKLSTRDFYGSKYPAGAVKTIVNSIYDIDPYWRNNITTK